MGYQSSCHAILRKHTLHSHLILKLCRFHGAQYQGKQGEEVRGREKGGINRVAAWSWCFYASKALLSKVGEGSGNEAVEVGDDRLFLNLAAHHTQAFTTTTFSSLPSLSHPHNHFSLSLAHTLTLGSYSICNYFVDLTIYYGICGIWQ